MPTDVVMPQMGESIFEGTITKWLKKPGDAVQRDEPLFEISTDKVDAEIPSPGAGVLAEIKVQEGATVQINTVVAVIGESDGAAAGGAVIEEVKVSGGSPVPTAPEKTNGAAPASGAAPAAGPATEVVMPQMGESIFEGTITKWLKQVGESVERDEPLFEISTDKVDAEIPSPVAGTLTEIKVQAGATVQINTVVGLIGGAAGAAAGTSGPSPVPTGPTDKSAAAAAAPSQGGETEIDTQRPLPAAAQASAAAAETAQTEMVTEIGHAAAPGAPLRSSPLVRRIAKDHNLDLSQVKGTGSAGRITKDDVLEFMEQGGGAQAPATQPAAALVPAALAAAPAPAASPAPAPAAPAPVERAAPKAPVVPAVAASPALPGELVPMSRMRSIIASRMVESKHTNAHVHTVFKIDMTRIVRLREKEKSKYEQRNGVKLTFMPFIARAVTATLRKMPIINASIEGDAIRYHQNINLGIAVALDWGLIVPVIKQAEERSFLGIARSIADLAERARGKKLKPDEVGTSTFTLTNAGIYGEQFGTPIINMPESAILGIGGLLKEPAVVTDESGADSIAIRSMIHLTLGFDHRIVDGADAGKFMAEIKKSLENWSEDIG